MREIPGHSSDGIKAVDADESRAISCGRDRTLRLWCLDKRENAKTVFFNIFCGKSPCFTNIFTCQIDLCGSPSAVKMQWPQAVVAVKSTNFEGV